ncbi:uncharacterized protein LOC143288913 isoform X2 [Babylonia areolata]
MIGVSFLAVGTLGFLAGFASPYWHFSRRPEDGGTRVHGLWVTCDQTSGTLSGCQDNVIRAEDWFRGVQFLLSSGALLLLVACLMAVVTVFAHKHCHRRLLDFAASFGAVFAMFGTLGYLVFTLSPPSLEESNFLTFTWGFAICATSSPLTVLAAILIVTGRAPPSGQEEGKEKGDKKSISSKGQQKKKKRGSSRLTRSHRSGTGGRGKGEGKQDMKPWLLPPEMYWMSNV